jgi:hypothetical protein
MSEVLTKLDDLEEKITTLDSSLTEKINKSGILGKLGLN